MIRQIYIGLAFAAGVLLAGCEGMVDPFVAAPPTYFALYGALDTAADTQVVRVSPLRQAAEPGPEPAEAEVRLRALETSQVNVWQRRTRRLEDGLVITEFVSAERVAPGTTYRLEAERPDGAVTTATVLVPPRPELTVAPAQGALSLQQRVTWLGLGRRPFEVTMRYRVAERRGARPVDIVIPYAQEGFAEAGGWAFTVALTQDRGEVLQRLGLPFDAEGVVLVDVGMEIVLRSPEWSDPEAAANIEQGVGFFGAVGRYRQSWTLGDDVLERLGYVRP